MPNSNTKVKFGNVDPALMVVTYHWNPGNPADGVYNIALSCGENAAVGTIDVQTDSGTATVEFRINNVPIVYAAASTTIAASSVLATKAAVSSKQIAVASKLTAVVSAGSSPVNLSATIHCVRNS